MKKLKISAAVLATVLVVFTTLPAIAAGPSGLSTVEYRGQDYYNVNAKADLLKAGAYCRDNALESLPIFFDANREWDSTYSNNVVNYFGYYSQGFFTYRGYSANTVCVTDYYQEDGRMFGNLELSYLDTRDELAKADAKIDAILSGFSGKSTYDKLLNIAEYVCKQAQYGSQQLPDGGYDAINGVYDVLTGVHTNTVCTSYALAFQRFMERAGINSYILADDGRHAWNIVELDGKWYGVDCTFGDLGNSFNRQYFLMGSDTMRMYNVSGANIDPVAIFARSHNVSANNYSSTGSPGNSGGSEAPARPADPSDEIPDSATAEITSAPVSATPDESMTAAVSEATLTVDVSHESVVGREVFEQAKQQGKTLDLQGAHYAWTFPAEFLAQAVEFPDSFDTSILMGDALAAADQEQLKTLAGDTPFAGFRFAYHGALPCTVGITLTLGKEFAGKPVTIYSVSDSGEAVIEAEDVVSADGILTFETDHCSLWFAAQMDASSGIAGWVWAVIALAVVLVVAAGVFCRWYFKRKNHN